jgi:hypothetical protein
MPCNDVTEILRLQLDHQDRVTGYSLTKRTCGGIMGKESLLMKWCGSLPATQVRDTTVDQFVAKFPTEDAVIEFVRLKHLLALQKGIAVLVGETSARPDDSIVLESVEYSAEGVELVAHIKVDMVTDEIRACGRCGSCGSKSNVQVPTSHLPE